jgi:hypothetical protein
VPPFSSGNRVLVLGAGATRGASTSEGRTCFPPLDADFFTQLQRITNSKHAKAVKDVVADVVQLFGSNFSLTMEEYFTELESIARMTRLAGRANAAFTPQQIADKRDRLMQGLAAVLEESTDVSRKGATPCEHHGRLVQNLSPRDTVISFNYDCVMDHALRSRGDKKWSARFGYALPKPSRIEGHQHWSAASAPSSASGSVNLLKLHGSLNWQLPPSDPQGSLSAPIKLKERLYQQRGTPRFTIIPPERVKNIDGDGNFRALWQNAERAIRNAKTIAFVGFSFTATDLHVESLFRVALAGSARLKTLIIANPNSEDRARIRTVFAKPLERSCLVRQYEDLADFAGHLDASAW